MCVILANLIDHDWKGGTFCVPIFGSTSEEILYINLTVKATSVGWFNNLVSVIWRLLDRTTIFVYFIADTWTLCSLFYLNKTRNLANFRSLYNVHIYKNSY
jgi:hypothetical protein